SGVVMGWITLGSLDALVGTGYGRLLLVKIGLAAVVAGLGAWNRFRLVPAVKKGVDPERPWHRLQRTVTTEAGVLVLAVLVTGFLVNQSPVTAAPPDAVSRRPMEFSGMLGDAHLSGVIDPGDIGANEMTITVLDE